jgi:predicted RNA-binding protein with PIN domain
MRIVIDGYNLIRRIPELRTLDSQDLEAGRDRLAHELSAYRAGKGHPITVVFDGAESIHLGGHNEKVRGVSVRYSPQGRSADSVIMEMCREGQADLIVSGDREIIDVAKSAGVTPVSPDLFWNKVQEEMYRRFKGEEPEDEDGGHRAKGAGRKAKGAGGRKLAKEQRKDRGRIDRL